MAEEGNQMGLFGEITAALVAEPPATMQVPRTVNVQVPRTARKKGPPPAAPAPKPEPPAKKVSGLVPQGDVRLTANIRQDLHLKLKIASARRRTTIGEILEELIEKHI